MSNDRFGAADVVAVIPARGGSKGVPGKNLRLVGGIPLVGRAVAAARGAGIDAVFVSTDDREIRAASIRAGAASIVRPADISGDLASSESVLLHALDEIAAAGPVPKVLAFLQATSPFIDPAALRTAVRRVLAGERDVVFSAFETYAFLWQLQDGDAHGVNHDRAGRPRRQDRAAHWQETGAFYVLDVQGFLRAGHRFFGAVGVQAVTEASAIEIDDLAQLELARRLAVSASIPPVNMTISAVVTDFDGVHTDDTALVGVDGVEMVRVSRADGLGVERLRRAGVPVLILSKERHPVVTARAAKLGVDVLQGVDDKAEALTRWCAERGIGLDEVAYVGNDVNDVEALLQVGWPIVPRDANAAVRPLARVVLRSKGGRGAVRELAEMVLAARRADAAVANEGEQ